MTKLAEKKMAGVTEVFQIFDAEKQRKKKMQPKKRSFPVVD
jgi:hypothetical protein